jgi:hypothetical protein
MEKDEKTEIAKIVMRQGEVKLSAQLTLALAAVGRASSFAGLFTTLGLAVAGTVPVLWTAGARYQGLMAAAVLEAVILLIAAYLCIQATEPVDFYLAGNRPKSWWDDNAENTPLFDNLKSESNNYSTYIEHNHVVIERDAQRFMLALRLVLLSPLAFLSVYGVTAFRLG